MQIAQRAVTLAGDLRSTDADAAVARLGTVLAAQPDSTCQDLVRRVRVLAA